MQREDYSKKRLIWLAGATAATLIGIIVLQVYWLVASYAQQKERFTEDARKALTNTLVKAQLFSLLPKTGLKQEDSLVMVGFSEIATNALSQMPPAALERLQHSPLVLSSMDTSDMPAGKDFLTALQHNMDSANIARTNLHGKPLIALLNKNLALYKHLFAAELDNVSINTPFQLAIVNHDGHFLVATCDTNKFEETPIKLSRIPEVEGTGKQTILIAAFPDADIYLVRHMTLLLSVTALLIFICVLSFSYLVAFFFREKRLSDIRNDFMNNMTHELKTPISAVSVAIEMASDDNHPLSDTSKREYLDIAQSELKRLTLLVDKVLKMAAFEKSEIKITPTSFAAQPWANEIAGSLKPLFISKNATVSISVVPESLMLYADKTHLSSVLQNLLENAIKYNDKPEPHISISLHQSGNHIALQVADNGRGIPQAYLGKVFDKFFRVPSGDLHDIKGYGLGLSYVNVIVELHGGTASVSSKENEGSVFTILLPDKKS